MKMVKQKRKLSQKQVLLIFCTVLVILTYIAATFPQPFRRRGTEIYGIHFAYTEDVQNPDHGKPPGYLAEGSRLQPCIDILGAYQYRPYVYKPRNEFTETAKELSVTVYYTEFDYDKYLFYSDGTIMKYRQGDKWMKQVHIGYGLGGEKGRELFEQLAGIAVPFLADEQGLP